MRSKIRGNEEKTGVIREMGCYLVLGLSLNGAFINHCHCGYGVRRSRSKNRWRKKGIILKEGTIGDEQAGEFVRCVCPIQYWLDKGRP